MGDPNQPATTTLREYLATNIPKFKATARGYSTKRNPKFIGEPVENIVKWKDFNTRNLNHRFGHILDEKIHANLLPPPLALPLEQLSVNDERSFEGVLLAYTTHVVNTALLVGARLWREHQAKNRENREENVQPIIWLYGSYFKDITEKPDWGAMRRRDFPEEQSLRESLVCGETKYANSLPVPYRTTSAQNTPFKPRKVTKAASPNPISTSQPSQGRQIQRRVQFSTSANKTQTPERPPIVGSEPLYSLAREASAADNGFSPPNNMEKVVLSWLDQVKKYAAAYNTRYCYIISPTKLLLCRRYKDPRVPLSEKRMSTRVQQCKAPFVPSSHSSHSSQRSQSSQEDSDDPNYIPPDEDLEHDGGIQVAEAIWEAQQSKAPTQGGGDQEERLSVNLALWAIHMLAGIGKTDVRSEYENWWDTED